MHRWFNLSMLVILLGFFCLVGLTAKPRLSLSGRLESAEVKILVKDTIYTLDKDYDIFGALIIEPGTNIEFNPDGRMVVHQDGRLIADGYARATYNPNPFSHNGTAIIPDDSLGSIRNPYSYHGYSDLRYFLYGCYNHNLNGVVPSDVDATIDISTPRKLNDIFDVVLDTTQRKIIDLIRDGITYPEPIPPRYRIPFEDAIIFITSKLGSTPADDNNLKIYPWRRIGDLSVNVVADTIVFKGQPFTDFSKDWKHSVVLPGARVVFFRYCKFNDIRIDTILTIILDNNDRKIDINIFPNPFSNSTLIKFEIPQSDRVVMTIKDVLGNTIAELLNKQLDAGSHEITFKPSDYGLSSGVYYFTLSTSKYFETRKMEFVK